MSLRSDRVLSQTYRYAVHRRGLASKTDRDASARSFIVYARQFDHETRVRMFRVYVNAFNGGLFEDRRIRGAR